MTGFVNITPVRLLSPSGRLRYSPRWCVALFAEDDLTMLQISKFRGSTCVRYPPIYPDAMTVYLLLDSRPTDDLLPCIEGRMRDVGVHLDWIRIDDTDTRTIRLEVTL